MNRPSDMSLQWRIQILKLLIKMLIFYFLSLSFALNEQYQRNVTEEKIWTKYLSKVRDKVGAIRKIKDSHRDSRHEEISIFDECPLVLLPKS